MRSATLSTLFSLAVASAGLSACTAEVAPQQPGGTTGGTQSVPTPGAGAAGTVPGAGGGSSVAGGGSNVSGNGPGPVGGGGGGQQLDCSTTAAVKAPLRRLTRFEYNNTVRDLAKVTDAPADLFPPEDVGSGFGTDAKAQSVSDVLAEKYMLTARSIAASLTAPARIAELAPCASAPAAGQEASCVRTVIDSFIPKAFRRALAAGDADGLAQLFQTVRAAGSSFPSSLAAVLEAALQSPEFLYRPEVGKAVAGRSDLLQPTDYEMANRLSYLLYASMPDAPLLAAAAAGQLSTPEGVRTQASRMFADPKARDVARYFFDNLLPIQALGSLTRSADFGGFTQEIGHLLRQETQTFLQDQMFNGGTWAQAFTAPYTFANQKLAAYYGLTGVTGDSFQKVALDGQKRAGLLTQGGVLAGPIHSDPNNPVVRGAFVLNKLMCLKISTPPASLGTITPPDPGVGGTSRDRYTAHSSNPACAGCHNLLDPIGFALENFNSVGKWQDSENGKAIDVTVTYPDFGTFSGAIELGKKMAESPAVHACFATNWANFAYGRGTDEQDPCTMQRLQNTFKAKNYDIKELLLELTQTDTFLYLAAGQP
jgi:Protein of unknown function (DUF1592)/Protein of unknown function (DUF1588)/Protein of unknown function (DUF1587)/Protein of unknown function (DUF1595)/Protein of unknown function (DUF1585)